MYKENFYDEISRGDKVLVVGDMFFHFYTIWIDSALIGFLTMSVAFVLI